MLSGSAPCCSLLWAEEAGPHYQEAAQSSKHACGVLLSSCTAKLSRQKAGSKLMNDAKGWSIMSRKVASFLRRV